MTSVDDLAPLRQEGRTAGRLVKGVVVPIAFVAFLGAFIWSERDRLKVLADAEAFEILVIALLVLVGHFLNSSEFWLLYRVNGASTRLFENWLLFLASHLGNYAPGQGGTVYRLRYMRVVHDVSYPQSVAVYGANFVATLAGASVSALAGVIGFAVATGDLSIVMLLVIAGTTTLVTAMAAVPLPRFVRLTGRTGRAWQSFHSGFEQIRRHPGTAASVVSMESAKYFVTAWRLSITFSLIGAHESFWLFLVLAPAAGVAQFIAFTPGGLGFREAFVTAAAAAMGVGFDTALLSAALDRGVLMLTALVAGSIGFAATYPRLRAATLADAASSPAG
jgi:uncharacterized membrane protein YbhN (UPF0104 family)